MIAFVEKGGTAGPGSVNVGVYLLRRSALKIIPLGRMVSLKREVIPELAGRGVDGGLGAWRHCSRMTDIVRWRAMLTRIASWDKSATV